MIRTRLLIILLSALILGSAAVPARAQTLTTLHNFGDGITPNDGLNPEDIILASDGNYYGITNFGGLDGFGIIFKMTPPGALTILTNGEFGYDNDDLDAGQSLIQARDGTLYGTDEEGGGAYGSAFSLTTSGSFTLLHTFGAYGTDGTYPSNALLQGPNGNFYGTTEYGGTAVYGTVFEMTPSGTITILHNFQDGTTPSDGSDPDGALALGPDGNFYGTTSLGGYDQNGTVYKITTDGHLTILHTFSQLTSTMPYTNSDGAYLYCGLVLGNDGNFYGVTTGGGTGGSGTVFKISPTGTFTTLHDFAPVPATAPFSNSDGASPNATLIQARDGNFYGTTYYGGPSGSGTIFQITPSGALTTLYSFSGLSLDPPYPNSDGANPYEGVVQDSAGNFYGVTFNGGAGGSGTVFRLLLAGAPAVPIWSAVDVAGVADGTARILWTRSDGPSGVWTIDDDDTQASIGPTYGPFPGWTAQAIGAAADATSRLLWTRTDGAASIWVLDAGGTQTAVGPIYGPLSGMTATDIATAPDGTSRLLWDRSDGAASVWTLSPNGAETTQGPAYGPFPGWTAHAVSAASDGTAHILWTRSDGAAGLWTLNAANVETTIGPTYGPYSDSHGAWTAKNMGVSSRHVFQVLWTRTDGAAGLWNFDAADVAVDVGPVYGPYRHFAASALDTGGSTAQVLWVRSDRAAGIWSIATDDFETVVGSVYGPF